MSQIEVRNLSYDYSEGTSLSKKAIDDININIEKGEFIGLIGHTGSGKSTFVKQLNGLLKPTHGEVYLDGHNIWENPKKIRDIRFKVGMVFQYPEHQLFEDTVYKDIAFGPSNMGLSKEQIEQKVIEAMNFVGLNTSILNKSPFELSGGEKRKAAIAGVIAMDPEVLVLDEPTAGLDPLGREQLLFHLNEYHKLRKKTIILISHNMEDIAKYTDKVMVLNKGKLLMFDSTKLVFTRADELEEIGLKLPQITRILFDLKSTIPAIEAGVLTVDEGVKEILNFIAKKGKTVVK